MEASGCQVGGDFCPVTSGQGIAPWGVTAPSPWILRFGWRQRGLEQLQSEPPWVCSWAVRQEFSAWVEPELEAGAFLPALVF